jgi:hypothetical protein
VTSLTDSDTGDGFINFTTNFSSADYCIHGGNNTTANARGVYTFSTSVSAARWVTVNGSDVAQDYDISVSAFGDQ